MIRSVKDLLYQHGFFPGLFSVSKDKPCSEFSNLTYTTFFMLSKNDFDCYTIFFKFLLYFTEGRKIF